MFVNNNNVLMYPLWKVNLYMPCFECVTDAEIPITHVDRMGMKLNIFYIIMHTTEYNKIRKNAICVAAFIVNITKTWLRIKSIQKYTNIMHFKKWNIFFRFPLLIWPIVVTRLGYQLFIISKYINDPFRSYWSIFLTIVRYLLLHTIEM